MMARSKVKKSLSHSQSAWLPLATIAGLAVIALSTVPAAGSIAATATATPSSPAEAITANVVSGPANIQVQAERAANAAPDSASGEFSAHISLGPLNLLTLQGPVTCLDVRGNQAGLFYPITSSSPALFSDLHSGSSSISRSVPPGSLKWRASCRCRLRAPRPARRAWPYSR